LGSITPVVSGMHLVQLAQSITPFPLADAPLRLNPYDFNQIDLTVVALPSLLASSGLQVSFDSTTPSVCSASVWTVYLISTGTCTVIANQAGDGTYAPAPQISQSFTVTPAFFSQTITFGALPNRQIGSAPFSVSATATSGATVRFTTLTPSTCSVTGTLVSLLAGGNCSIAADQAGGGAWLAAPQVVQSFTITLLTQTITFPALGNLTLGANPFVPTVSASSGLPVTLTSLTPTTCAVSGISVTLMAPGLCTLQADQAGSATFTAAAPVTQGFTVLGVAQGTLSYAAPLTTARYYHTATLLTNGKVLVAGGEDLAGEIATAEIYDPATNLWSPAGTLVTPRHRHTVTLLPNGKVLIVGGSALGQLLASSELYDPSTNTWTSTQGSLSVPRDGHTATLLSNGTVLVTNGEGSQGNVVSTELYDPSTGTWSPRAPMGMPHGNFATATLLANGKVLVVGGNDGTSTLASAELYDPSNNTWSSAGSMALPRSLHFATLLTSGKVLVATGGVNSNLLSSAELFDPATMSWSSAGAMANARMRSTVALLPNGKVWVAGGQDGSGGDVMSTELYDPASNGWSQAAPLSTPRTQATATLLPSGRVLVVGGNNWNFTELDSTEIFSMVSDAWDATPAPLLTGRFNQQNLLLLDGRVLSSGGRDGTTGAFQTTELRDPVSGLWTPGPAMTAARQNHAATLLQTGEVFVSGGLDANNAALASTERWNPSGSGWVAATPMASSARFSHRQTLLGDGSVLVTGGQTSGSSASLATAERYNPTTGTWASAGTMTVPRVGHRATLLRDGRVLVSGGTSGTAYYANVDVYDPGADSWTALPPMSVPRGGHRVVLLPDGRVMVIGGQTTGGVYLDSVEIYDPANNAWSLTGSLSTARIQAAANVLPTGEVIVAGGTTTGGVVVASAERYDAVAGTWLPAGSLATARRVPGSVLLHDGRILYAGGAVNTGSATTNSVEVYRRDLGFDDAWRPVISTAPTTVGQGGKLYVTGSRFKGLSEASGGGNASRNSPTNHPIALLQRMDGGEQLWLGADALSSFGSTAFTSGPVTGMAAGPALLTVFANGIPSVAKAVVVGGSTTSSSVVLASSVNPSRVLSNTVLSVTVAGASPTGYVQFKDGGANLGGPVPVMDGTAQRIWSWPVVGTHAITAEYSGDANFAASTSGVLTQVVIPYLSTTTVSAQFYIPPSGGDVYAGGPWTARASVTGASPTGSVHFFAGAWDLGVATLQNGQAVLPDIIALRLTGVYSLSAIYSGDANNTASTSTNPVSVTVVRAFTVVELTGSSATAAAGESLTFLATVIGPDPGGLVQFKLDGVNFGSPVIMVGRVAQLTTSALPIGAHNLTAMYSGDQNNLGSTSTQLVVTIAAPTGDVPILPEWAAVLLGLLLLATVRRSGWR
jgi:N-acetylneuraminic acid mutarotase